MNTCPGPLTVPNGTAGDDPAIAGLAPDLAAVTPGHQVG
jgi:hypothetical protein